MVFSIKRGADLSLPLLRKNRAIKLEEFVEEDDRISYGPNSDSITSAYLFASYHLCHVNVINSFPSLLQLHVHLDFINLLNPDRLRPSWDSYFMVRILLNV